MTQIQLTITLPEDIWIGEVSRAHPDVTFHVQAAVPAEDRGFALVRLTGESVDAVIADIDGHEGIVELTVVQQTDEEATIQFETETPMLQFAAQASGLPIELPIQITDGEAVVEATGPHERLSQLGTQLRQFGLEFQVEYIQERLHTSQLLSEKQRELVLEAVERGYYDTPRDCTLTELAEAVDLAKSTCSETLHRAEETMVKHFVDDLPTPRESEQRIVAPD